eukprot:scaffold40646_cov206-Amphora_coffeaeformis.AAC.4
MTHKKAKRCVTMYAATLVLGLVGGVATAIAIPINIDVVALVVILCIVGGGRDGQSFHTCGKSDSIGALTDGLDRIINAHHGHHDKGQTQQQRDTGK